MSQDKKDDPGLENLVRLTPRRFAGFNDDNDEESAIIVGLFKKEPIGEEEKNLRLYKAGYDLVYQSYLPTLQTRKTPGGQPISRRSYFTIWDNEDESLSEDFLVKVSYKAESGRIFKRTKEHQCQINSASLEMIASARKNKSLVEVNFMPKDYGKFQALIDLSFEALKSPDLSINEGRALIKNAYLALYITGKEMDQKYYQIFCQMEWPQKFGDYLTAIKEVKEELSKFTKQLRREYLFGFKYEGKPVRKSKEVEELLGKKKKRKILQKIFLLLKLILLKFLF